MSPFSAPAGSRTYTQCGQSVHPPPILKTLGPGGICRSRLSDVRLWLGPCSGQLLCGRLGNCRFHVERGVNNWIGGMVDRWWNGMVGRRLGGWHYAELCMRNCCHCGSAMERLLMVKKGFVGERAEWEIKGVGSLR